MEVNENWSGNLEERVDTLEKIDKGLDSSQKAFIKLKKMCVVSMWQTQCLCVGRGQLYQE